MQVANYLPSISSAIGGYAPQKYIWRICIALHAAPRFLFAFAYFGYYTSFHVGPRNSLYKNLARLCVFLHVLENTALVTLTYVSSTDNYGKFKKAKTRVPVKCEMKSKQNKTERNKTELNKGNQSKQNQTTQNQKSNQMKPTKRNGIKLKTNYDYINLSVPVVISDF